MLQALRTGFFRLLLGLAVFSAGAAQFQDVAFSVHRAMHVINASGAGTSSESSEIPVSGSFLDGDCGLCLAHHLTGNDSGSIDSAPGAVFAACSDLLPEGILLVSGLDPAQAPRAPPSV